MSNETKAKALVFAVVTAVILGGLYIAGKMDTEKATTGSYDTTVIQGCEYFICPVYGGKVIVHKGNCTNPIHRN